ncbi:WD40 domain-containing protein, partial [Cephalotus follicularis]
LDQAHSLLTNRTKEVRNSKYGVAYQQKLVENLTLDSEGRPFRMLVFRGSPKSCRKSIRFIDEMRREEIENDNTKKHEFRRLPLREARILDAPKLKNDYYLNIIDWGKNNIIAVALGSDLYLWNSENKNIQKLSQGQGESVEPTSLAWSQDAKTVAVGYMCSKLSLFDAETLKVVRNLEGHNQRVGAVAWNDHILTSGSGDSYIINHDVRARNSLTSRIEAHNAEVCGLKWSSEGNILASGGNENVIYIWEASKMGTSNFLYKLSEHRAAVKALAWCPYQFKILASGGGTKDGCIKIWNTQKGICIDSIETKAQICGLEWNRHHNEILSGHGYSNDASEHQNQLCLWRYPSMTKVGEMKRHRSRVVNLCQSPDGLTVLSAGADETLRFWDIFGPPCIEKQRVSNLDGLLSLKTSPIR